MFSQAGKMRRHVKEVHDGIKDIACTSEGCTQMFTEARHMRKHVKAVHDGIKDIACTHEGCTKMFSLAETMQRHVKLVHDGIKDIACTSEGCTQMFTAKKSMQAHYESWHTKEGMQKKIKKQDRVHTLLKTKYAVDSECHIRYSGGCIPDPDKFYSRLDFHIIGITDYIVIVECDEYGHTDYLLSCEQTRMLQTAEAIHNTRGQEVCPPIIFVRFNCDKARIDGEKIQKKQSERDALLMNYLHDIHTGIVTFSDPVNITYINYNVETQEDGTVVPEIMSDPDFVVNNLVRAVVVME